MARKFTRPSYNLDAIKTEASTRWQEIISSLGGVPLELLDGTKQPCPKCGGTDRFRYFNDGTGGAICGHCLDAKNGDGFSVLQWLTGDDFQTTIKKVADHLNIQPQNKTSQAKKTNKKSKQISFIGSGWNDVIVGMFCMEKKHVTPAAIQATGGGLGKYGAYNVIALPIIGETLSLQEPAGHSIWNATGGMLQVSRGRNKPPLKVKVRVTKGSTAGIISPDIKRLISEPEKKVTIWKTEGPSDALALWGKIPDADRENNIVLCNGHGASEKPKQWVVDLILKHADKINVVHDSDMPGQQGATIAESARGGRIKYGWAPCLASAASDGVEVRNVILPYPIEKTHGKDLRDYFSDGHTFAELSSLAERVEPTPQIADLDISKNEMQPLKAADDPSRLAALNLANYTDATRGGDVVYWRQEWWVYKPERGYYKKKEEAEFRANVTLSIQREFERLNIEDQKKFAAGQLDDDEPPTTRKVSTSLVGNVIAATKATKVLPASIENNTWIGDAMQKNKNKRPNCLAMKNGILDLDAVIEGREKKLLPHTKNWFTIACLPYEYSHRAKCPAWNNFLDYNLDGDLERIAILQEWAGYLLTPDTGEQKFLILEGEGANGKSVYLAAIGAMLGSQNVSHVPLEVFGDRFSRTQTLGKLANIAADCGDIDKISEGYIKSFTSGDTMFFDRKGVNGIDTVPTARMMFAVNNRPRFTDRSTGIWRRMLLVPWLREVPREKRIRNMDKAAWWEESIELPGILNWAIEGLKRLRKNGFTQSKICDGAISSYQDETNPAKIFLHDTCEKMDEGEAACKSLYILYKRWCDDNGYRALGNIQFGKEVKRLFPTTIKKRRSSGSNRFYVYEGIIFSDPNFLPDEEW